MLDHAGGYLLHIISGKAGHITGAGETKALLKNLGGAMEFQGAYDFVKNEFGKVKEHGEKYGFREKWSHTERVVKWAKRLSEKLEVEEDVLVMAAIFHDVGYTVTITSDGHAKHSEEICRKYLLEHGYKDDFVKKVCGIVLTHGNKELLRPDNPNMEQVLLIEADCLDENGAMSVIRDAICEGAKGNTSYEEVYERITRYPLHDEMFDCVTDAAREIWEEKKRVFWEFVASLQRDVGRE